MSVETFLDGRIQLHCGDCLAVMDTLEESSVDSCVCDPPYHLQSIVKRFAKTGRTDKTRTTSGPHQRTANGFMNKVWDGGDVAFQVSTWEKVLRVLKPGAYIVAFSSSRTFGRMSVAIEDAGFITHPMIGWIFGQGFPKAHRIAYSGLSDLDRLTEGWEGWRYGGQALKPALEPIYVGQKPFSEINGSANVQRWGTGALNINACRIDATDNTTKAWRGAGERDRDQYRTGTGGAPVSTDLGRWPANVMTDGSMQVFDAFPNSDGAFADVSLDAPSARTGNVYGKMNRRGEKSADARYHDKGSTDFAALPGMRRNDSGSAARFFWSSKAIADDRLGSKHPTVKPIDLIEELITLVTPPGGLCLDCFAGTGSLGEAAFRRGFGAILIEREPEYQADIRRRMALCVAGPEERKRESLKAKFGDQAFEPGSLFAAIDTSEAAE